jgi:hypothetical protein
MSLEDYTQRVRTPHSLPQHYSDTRTRYTNKTSCRPRTLRSRTPPPPRHPRLRLHPLLPPLLLVHIRRTPHGASLPRPRHPALPANRQPPRRKQTLPTLHLLPAESAEPTHPTRQHKVIRLPRIPLVTAAQLLGPVAAECGERGPEFVEAAQEPLCG